MVSVVERVDEVDHGCSKRCHAEGRQYGYEGGWVDVLCMNDSKTSRVRTSVGEGGVDDFCVRRV